MGAADEARTLAVSWLIRTARGEDPTAAIERLEALAAETNDDGERAVVTTTRAKLAFLQGDMAKARDLFFEAAEQFGPLSSVWFSEAGHYAVWAAEIEPLRRIAQRLDAHGQASLPYFRADRKRMRAALAAMAGDPHEATALFRASLRELADMSVWFDRAVVASEAVFSIGSDDPEIAAAADDAEAIFRRLGAKPYLALLERARARTHQPAPVHTTETVSVS